MRERRPAVGLPVGSSPRRQRLTQVRGDFVDEAFGGEPALAVADQQGQVLGHGAALDGLDADALKGAGEAVEFGIAVELGAVF